MFSLFVSEDRLSLQALEAIIIVISPMSRKMHGAIGSRSFFGIRKTFVFFFYLPIMSSTSSDPRGDSVGMFTGGVVREVELPLGLLLLKGEAVGVFVEVVVVVVLSAFEMLVVFMLVLKLDCGLTAFENWPKFPELVGVTVALVLPLKKELLKFPKVVWDSMKLLGLRA